MTNHYQEHAMLETETTFDAETRIENALDQASSVSVDGMSVSNRSVDEIIKADKHLARKRSSGFGLRIAQQRAPGQY
jgi:ribosome maturation protein Sdo1